MPPHKKSQDELEEEQQQLLAEREHLKSLDLERDSKEWKERSERLVQIKSRLCCIKRQLNSNGEYNKKRREAYHKEMDEMSSQSKKRQHENVDPETVANSPTPKRQRRPQQRPQQSAPSTPITNRQVLPEHVLVDGQMTNSNILTPRQLQRLITTPGGRKISLAMQERIAARRSRAERLDAERATIASGLNQAMQENLRAQEEHRDLDGMEDALVQADAISILDDLERQDPLDDLERQDPLDDFERQDPLEDLQFQDQPK